MGEENDVGKDCLFTIVCQDLLKFNLNKIAPKKCIQAPAVM